MTETHETRLPSPRELKALIEAERSGQPFLQWRNAVGEQQLRTLVPEQPLVTVGRRAESDVPLTWDKEVSRVHAMIELIGGAWTVVDDGLSRNGSFVNGSRVHGRHRLEDSERMCFGNTHVVYHDPVSDRGSESTARALDSPGGIPLTETQRKVLIALCRPIAESTSTIPATNPQIAGEVNLSVEAVKAQLRGLFGRFGLGELPQNEKRSRLVALVLSSGILRPHDF